MCGTLDFKGSEDGGPPFFSQNTTLLKVLKVDVSRAVYLHVGVCPLHV